MPITPTEKVWMNGSLVDWADAKIHILTHTLHYGSGVFEGMRCYATADGPAVFRLDDHMERFFKSADLYELAIPYSKEALVDATLELIRANRLETAYLR